MKVSPQHTVRVDDDYLRLIERAPRQDFVVRTLAKRMVGDLPLMSGDLVIAGAATREAHPLAQTYPLHFRKTYYPGQLRGDPRGEFERHTRASALVKVPPPIGYTASTFRSCLLPGRPFSKLSPFGTEPEESNLKHAADLTLASAAGLWRLAEEMLQTHDALQAGGLAHGDAELHNFVVCPSPLAVLPIDFDMAVSESQLGAEAFRAHCARDLVPLLKLAIYLQCALGPQEGALAAQASARIDELFTRPAVFRRAIEERGGLSGIGG